MPCVKVGAAAAAVAAVVVVETVPDQQPASLKKVVDPSSLIQWCESVRNVNIVGPGTFLLPPLFSRLLLSASCWQETASTGGAVLLNVGATFVHVQMCLLAIMPACH